METSDPALEEKLKALEEKLAQRDALQREIKDLRRAVGTTEQYIVNVKLLELNRTKLKQAGFDLASLDSNSCQLGFRQIACSDDYLGFLGALGRDGIVDLIADPTLVTVDGRPASFHAGGIVWLPSGEHGRKDPEKFGTEVEVLVEPIGNNKAKLRLKLRQSTIGEVGPRQPPEWIPSSASQVLCWALSQLPSMYPPPPTSHVTEINTGIEATLGKPVLLGGLRTAKTREVQLDGGVESRREDFEMLVFISVEAAGAMDPEVSAVHHNIQPATYPPPVGY